MNTHGSGGHIKFKTMFQFLGIHWAQFPESWELRDRASIEEAKRRHHLILEEASIEGVSGMTLVIPSWQVLEVLEMPKLKERREKAHAKYLARRAMRSPTR